MFDWLPWRRSHRAALRERPVPEAWRIIVAANVPLVSRLDPRATDVLWGHVHVFLDDKVFEGCGGLHVTERMRVTIAAHAVLLLVGLDVDVPFPGLDVVRLYPASYRTTAHSSDGFVTTESLSHRLGESSDRGYVVLSWRDVIRGADPTDGHNVVLHELAHQLDQADGVADGAPVLPRSLYGPWAKHLGAAFEELQEDVAKRRRNVMDGYGATNPAEFFAVATETFFERGKALRRQEPELYDVLKTYYGQDPAQW
jgi:Mlc titration factor MtfA (ptsG expression regulator)